MNVPLIVVGLAFLAAAIVGGGLKASGVEVPVIASVKRQVLLAILGAIAVAFAFIVPLMDSSASASGSTHPSGTPQPTTATSSATAIPTTSTTSTTPAQTGTGDGAVVAQYSIDLANNYSIPLAAGPKPTPVGSGGGDLAFLAGEFLSDGQIALLDATTPTYSTCKNDTRYTSEINQDSVGTVVCFTGHGVVAGIVVTNTGSDPSYLSLNVTVWHDSSSAGQ